jgi:diacylglycerol O-acyltransferase / wax synthase
VMTAAGRVPHLWHRWFARTVYSSTFFNTIVSFMPAARGPRWLAGARVRALYPVLPLTKGVPLTFGIVVFDGVAGVGIMLDTRLGLRRGDVESAVRRAFGDAQAALG